MEVKAGYKETEVGIIPEDWGVKSFGELFNISGGLSASRDQLSSEGHCYLHYGDIHLSNKTFIDVKAEYQDIPKLNIPLNKVSTASLLKDGDIVFVDASEDDEGASKHVVIVNREGIPYISGLHTIVAKSKTDELNHHYRRYCFQTRAIKKQFLFYSVGTKVTGISKTNIAKILLPVPSIPEQKAIAEALSDVDALIEALEQLLAKKRQVKQGAMQELLTGKRRLPGFIGEWVTKLLGDIAHIQTGGKNNQDKVEDGEYPFFVRSATVERINSYSYDCEAILVPGEGNIGNIFHYINGRFDVHQRVYAITQFQNGVSGKFVYLYMAQYFGKHALKNTVKATVDSLRLPTFLNFEVLLPPTNEEQTAIAEILSDMDAEIAALEGKLSKARQVKRGMMSVLLTGKIRLVESE
jgi:type I restriction enzyme S subunit